MKTFIRITGQKNSVKKIYNPFHGTPHEVIFKDRFGQRIDLLFKTKKEAVQALKEAYDVFNFYDSGASYYGTFLTYDAGQAGLSKF
jgi:hypothetical protein